MAAGLSKASAWKSADVRSSGIRPSLSRRVCPWLPMPAHVLQRLQDRKPTSTAQASETRGADTPGGIPSACYSTVGVMAKLYLKRTLTGFAPADEASQEIARKYKVGEVYRADVVKPRSYQHHKLCFALLGLTFEKSGAVHQFREVPEGRSTRSRSYRGTDRHRWRGHHPAALTELRRTR